MGLPPLFQLPTGFVVHQGRNFPCTVFQTQFAKRIARKPGEYQQRKTNYQYAQNNGLVRQFHGLLLLAFKRVRGYIECDEHTVASG